MKTNIYIDGTDARAAFGVWVVRGGGPAGPGEFGRGRIRTPANLAGYSCVGANCIRPHETPPRRAE